MALDLGCIGGPRLDDVGVQGPLDEEANIAHFDSNLFENPDKGLADDLALRFRVGHSRELGEKPVFGIDVDEIHVEARAERVFDLGCLVFAEQPVIYEYAHQLVTDCLVHKRRRN